MTYISGPATKGQYDVYEEVLSPQDFAEKFGKSPVGKVIQAHFADPDPDPLFFRRNIGSIPAMEPDWAGFRSALVPSAAWIRISGAAEVGIVVPFIQLLFALSDSSISGEVVALWQAIKQQAIATQQELDFIAGKATEYNLPQELIDAI